MIENPQSCTGLYDIYRECLSDSRCGVESPSPNGFEVVAPKGVEFARLNDEVSSEEQIEIAKVHGSRVSAQARIGLRILYSSAS